MKLKNKRWASLAVALTMSVSLMSGCGSSEQANQTNTPQPTPSASSEPTEEAPYAPEKDLEISYWQSHGADLAAIANPTENIPGDWIEAKSRVKITEAFGNGGQDPVVKLGMMAAGDMLPNIGISSNQIGFDKAVEGNQLWGLTPELLEKYAPDVLKSLPDYAWDAVTVDGVIYGIPFELLSTVYEDIEGKDTEWHSYYGLSAQSATWNAIGSSSCFLIRDDILKQLYPSALGYEEALAKIEGNNEYVVDQFILPIKTTEEYTKLMYDIKALGLTENGKPVYPFGYPKGDNWTSLTALGGEMIGYKSYNYMSMYNASTQKLEFGLLTSAVKEAAQIQNRMIRDSVIDPESVVHTSEQFKEKILNGQYAITTVLATGMVGIGNIVTLNDQLKANGKSYSYVPLITEIENLPEYPPQYTVPVVGGANNYMWLFKTIKEEDLPQILNWINIMFTDEWEEIKYWGPKEAGLYKEENGKRVFVDENLQKGLIEGDANIDPKSLKGFATRSQNNLGFDLRRYPTQWSYEFVYRDEASKNRVSALTKFPVTSKYTQNLLRMPEFSTWKADFKNIPQVNDLLTTRNVWEEAFKYPLIAKNDEDFEKKWQEAIDTLKSNVDIDTLLTEQTKIFDTMLEELKNR